ncbi:hypothetical protein BKA66DRAFT_463175 [Pyrenochaeta sp. MPI-SDFR-AT-0127]|nr:hypothetical protein BKA66DRAFT_463175 [Pyrenochaeta sp. MPI-SDFR-AT-0127]
MPSVTQFYAGLLLSLFSLCINDAAAISRLANRADLGHMLAKRSDNWSSATTISFPGSAIFSNATERWTTFSAPTYSAAISPANENDLANIVKYATGNNISFLATGGRHGYTTTYKNLQNGLAIDLSRLDTLEVNATSGTLTVGPGVTIGEVIQPLFDAGLTIQTGSCPCPSLIGVTVGGGVGRYQGSYGLVIDALVSVRMVTAKGEIIHVSEDSHPDLFWAIRGAGSNFGIITSATYEAHPLTDDGDIFVGEFIVPSGRESEYFELLERMSPIPAELASFMFINYNSTSNRTQAQVQWTYKGHEEAARKALAPILNFGLEITLLETRKWTQLISDIFGIGMDAICAPGFPRNLYSWNLKQYSATTYKTSFTKMVDFFANYPRGRNSYLGYEFFPNQAMAAVPLDQTAFPWRDSTGYINYNVVFEEGDNVTEAASTALGLELRKDLVATSGYPELTVFVSYAHGDEKLEQIYSKEKLPRLASLKKIWDPQQVFNYNNGLPTQYP